MKKIQCLIIAFLFLTPVFSLEVDKPELEGAGSSQIEFENYGGPYAVIESAEAITGIGEALGRVVHEKLTEPATVEPNGKYTLIHAVDGEKSDLLDGDILVLSENAGVDHIKNLRRILTGYLNTAYGYSREDSETIATFVTIYNAVYRKQIETFKSKYKDVVLKNLSAEKAGLSTNWEEWAGNTQIVIPLRDPDGGISTVDTTTISDEQVIEALKEEEDKGIDIREQLTDIKANEAGTAQEKAKDAQKDAAAQKKEGNTEAAKKSAEVSSEQQKLADTKALEVKEDRAEIAKDKQALLEEREEYLPVTGLFGADGKNKLFRLITVDANTGKVLLKSQMTQVRSKAVYTVNDITVTDAEGTATYPQMYLAICGINDGHSAVRLCLMDSEQLVMRKQSAEFISENSELVQYGDSFYVIVQEGKEFFVATYSKDAVLKQKSALSVNSASPMNLTANGLLVTDASGNPALIDTQSLATIWTSPKENDRKGKKNSRKDFVEK